MNLKYSLAEIGYEHAIDIVAFALYYLVIKRVIRYNIATSNIDLQSCPIFLSMSCLCEGFSFITIGHKVTLVSNCYEWIDHSSRPFLPSLSPVLPVPLHVVRTIGLFPHGGFLVPPLEAGKVGSNPIISSLAELQHSNPKIANIIPPGPPEI